MLETNARSNNQTLDSRTDTRIRIANITEDSFVDGPGIRFVIWCQGCPHHCPGCHNPQTHCPNKGEWIGVDELLEMIEPLEFHTGITLSGGEPFLQSEALGELVRRIRERRKDLTIWCYTGYTIEELIKDENNRELLSQLDMLVDGPFILELKDTTKNNIYRGSSNQRLIPKGEIQERMAEKKEC